MYTVQEESTQRSSTLKASKKKGWEILYTPAEGSDEQNTSVFVPYEDFGDKLTVIDGYANVLSVTVNDAPSSLKIEDGKQETTFTVKYGNEDTPIDSCEIYYNADGIVTVTADSETKALGITPIKAGKVTVTLHCIQNAADGNRIGVATIDLEVKPIEADNKMTYNDQTYNLVDNIDPNLFVAWDDDTVGPTTQTIPIIDASTGIESTVDITDWDKLTSLTIAKADSTKTTINDNFLAECEYLAELNIWGLSNVKSVGSWFLCGCTSLVEVNLSALNNVTTIGDGFLDACSSLTSIDLSPLSKVKSVGEWFLSTNGTLDEINMGVMKGLEGDHSTPVVGGSCIVVQSLGALKTGNIKASAFTADYAIKGEGEEPDHGDVSFVFIKASAPSSYKTLISGTYASDIIAKFPKIEGTFTDETTGAQITHVYRDLVTEIVRYGGEMTYNGVIYELSPNINPNLFVTKDANGQTLSPTIPTVDGSIQITNWSNLTSLKLQDVGSEYANDDVADNFLSDCYGLQYTPPTFLPSNWNPTAIGDNFLSSICLGLVRLVFLW
ncbi:MAG: leucine-rich repeat protein [Malacoplasma sp.]|nr:leucine-rich repeat protein [Malacoplasma sp.]